MDERPRVIAIMGPTGVGKSRLALQLAKDLDAEIINADSVQVYRFLNVGTAKPTAAERAEVSHHLLDILDPDEDFDVCRYSTMARALIENLASHGKLALVVGGTGLYLKAVFHGIFPGAPSNRQVRQRLREEAKKDNGKSLYRRLQEVDPLTGQRLHPNDLFRIIRALEVWECTGKPVSALRREHGFRERPFQALKIGLNLPRRELYDRIDRRVEEMMAQGFLQEVKELVKLGYGPQLKSMQALGYRHLLEHVTADLPLSEALRTLKRDTRRYAKRQLTWFRRDSGIHWFHPQDVHRVATLAHQFLRLSRPTERFAFRHKS
ncbi:MAG: tRNA (adenosine(37)-N6)-dimethylallyltransferase MiaA [Deltaproteobacteria bacterium]|nr:MAG: tRNA (adenosine(37)-N6)-dimethylallyltransferase MiaA [Deltaproteobacteria bacterium]